jgi:hypothetical protein
MSNLSKQSQNLPAKQNHGLSVVLGVAGNFATKVVEALPAMISSVAGYFAYLRGLDWYWIALIAFVVFCCSVWLFNGFLWLKDRRDKRNKEDVELPATQKALSENTDTDKTAKYEEEIKSLSHKMNELETNHRNNLESLKEAHQKEIESLKAEHRNEIEALKAERENETEEINASLTNAVTNVQTAVKINDERIAKLNEIAWLIELAEKQAKTISSYVIAEEVKYSNHDFEGRSHYKVIFVIRVSNKSVFNIAFENSIGGWLKFNHEPFLGEKRFAETPLAIKPFETGFIRIEQRLSSTEVEMLERAMQKYEKDCENYKSGGIPVASQIDLYDLIITVKANEKFPTVLSKPLHTFNLSFDVTKKEFNL